MLIAGLVAQFVSAALPRRWGTSPCCNPRPPKKASRRVHRWHRDDHLLAIDHTARRRLGRGRPGSTQFIKRQTGKFSATGIAKRSVYPGDGSEPPSTNCRRHTFSRFQHRPDRSARRAGSVHSVFQSISYSGSFQSRGACKVSV